MITVSDLQPFTYYKSSDNRRGFNLANIVDGPMFHEEYVQLIEFGEPRTRPIKVDLKTFLNEVNNGRLIKFVPAVQ